MINEIKSYYEKAKTTVFFQNYLISRREISIYQFLYYLFIVCNIVIEKSENFLYANIICI